MFFGVESTNCACYTQIDSNNVAEPLSACQVTKCPGNSGEYCGNATSAIYLYRNPNNTDSSGNVVTTTTKALY